MSRKFQYCKTKRILQQKTEIKIDNGKKTSKVQEHYLQYYILCIKVTINKKVEHLL